MNKAAHAYFQTKVSTTDQGQLLLMLYDGALKYLQQARDKMLARDFAAKGILISKVIDIVNELAASLNMDKGGSLAVNLNNLYLLCTARLLRANLKMDMESLDSVEKILSGLRGAYAQIIETPEARKAAADIASRMQPAGSTLKTAQPVMTQSVTAVPRAHAQAVYGRNALRTAPQPPTAPAGQPVPGGAVLGQAGATQQARAHVQPFMPSAPPVSQATPVAAGQDAGQPGSPAAASMSRLPGAYAKSSGSA